MSNLVKEVRYVYANIEGNNNKFWYAELYDDGTFKTTWGRVGGTIQEKEKKFSYDNAILEMDKKCREKEKKGYNKIEVLDTPGEVITKNVQGAQLEEIAKKQIKRTQNTIVDKLIDRLIKTNAHNILNVTSMTYNVDTGLFSTPCGIVTQDTIDRARVILDQISDYIINNKIKNRSFDSLFEQYLMLIPQNVGYKKLNIDMVFSNSQDVQKQNSILDSLEVSIKTILDGGIDKNNIQPYIDEQIFNVELTIVEDGKTIDRITKKFLDTLDRGYVCAHLRPKNIYVVDIESMSKAFDEKGKSIGNIHEYFHGTRVSNVLSILKEGLIIPPARAGYVTGRLMGDGLYFSDQSTKSLNYSYGYWDNTRDDNCFMFLADVAMGKPYVPTTTYSSTSYPVNGYDSTFADVKVTSGLKNNEMIVYNTYQANLTYLIEFSSDGK